MDEDRVNRPSPPTALRRRVSATDRQHWVESGVERLLYGIHMNGW
ncbi:MULTISPECIES: hypothetical protein [unclassified Variovorax]